ncbi:hypothetical protein [Bradyrhizobium sp. Tv2a-2]|uniref:hypothetical protein n=1 Tax=Bradyrhizobium sp. Tv2a-2 TaxID=113395 RepID=UPI0004080B56|nr:hypothetical protein [Bradyrhizobium sp. Tv2a-2]
MNSEQRPGIFVTGASPIPQLPSMPRQKPGGLLGRMIDAGYIDSDLPPAGGLVGLIQDHLRNNPAISR